MNYIVALVTATTCVACLSSPKPLEEETRTDTTSEPTDVVETIGETDVETLQEPDVETVADVEIEVEAIQEVETQDAEVETQDAEVEAEVIADVEVETEVAPSSLALGLAQSQDIWVIENERIKMVLEERSGWLPAQLAAGPDKPNVVHGERVDDQGQTNEEWLGLILFDLAYLWRHDVTPDVDERGPAVVTLWKTWQLEREGLGVVMTGRTDMTVHADGRVMIAYDFQVPTLRDDATLVAYIALDISRFTTVAFSDGTQFTLPADQTETGEGYIVLGQRQDTDYLCASADTGQNRHALGFAAKRAGTNLLQPRITQNSYVLGQPDADWHSVRLQYDLARGNVPAGSYSARLLLTIDDSRNCDNVAAHAAAFQNPPGLLFSTGNLDRDQLGDIEGDGYNDLTGAYTVETASRSLAFRALESVPSMTLRVLSSTWGAVSVSIDGTPLVEGTDFVAQPSAVDRGGWIVIAREVPSDVLVEIAW